MVKKNKRVSTASSPPPAKRSQNKKSTEAAPISLQTLGIEFLNAAQQEKFATLYARPMFNTRFSDEVSMKEIGVLDGVKKLFTNIGWQGLLEWDNVGYKSTTLEFLSSTRLEDEVLHFRLLNKSCTLTINQICLMIGAPTKNTFLPSTRTHPDFNATLFWRSITAKLKYVCTNAKASQIVHPTLRVAHRLLSCIISARGDAGGVTQLELYLLWCMIHPQPSKPSFGHYLCQKLLQVSNSQAGKVYCSSIITVLGHHDSLQLHFPDSLKELKGPRYLNMAQMIRMKLFEQWMGGKLIWLKGTRHCKHLSVPKSEQEQLALADPTAETNWLPERNYPAGVHEPTSDIEQNTYDTDDSREDIPPSQDGPVDPSLHHHDDYLPRFTAIDTEIAALRRDFTDLRTEIAALRGDFTDLRAMLQFMYAHQREMGRSITLLRAPHSGRPS